MKKIFGTLAIALCLVAMASCGGDKQKKEKAKADADPVKAKVEYFINKAETITDDDYAAQQAWFTEVGVYVEGLSEADQEKFVEYFEKMMAAESEDPEDIEEYADDMYEQAEEYADDMYEQAEEYAGDMYEQAEEYAEDLYRDAERMAEDLYNGALDGYDW